MDTPTSIVEIQDLKGLLTPKIGSDYEIVNYSTKNLTALGDNYGSTMLSLTVQLRHSATGEEKSLELAAKLPPRDPMFFAIFQVPLSFPKECLMYTDVAEEIKRHQDEFKVSDSLRLDAFCECFGTRRNFRGDSGPVDKDAVLLLENLKVQGYRCGDRTKGLDKSDTEFVLKNLARFHAVPIAIRYLKPEVFEAKIKPALLKINMAQGMQPEMLLEMDEFMNKSLKCIPEVSHLEETIKRQLKAGWDYLATSEAHRMSPYSTICHSDFWVNNMMQHYDENGNPDTIRIVDYQITSFDSVAHDVVFFLFTSVENAVIEANLEHFLEFYFNEFYWCLMANGCPMEDFTYDSFLAELNELAGFELQHVTMMMKVLMTDSKKLEGETEPSLDFMTNRDLVGQDFYNKLKFIFLAFEKKKWLFQ